MKGNPIVRLIRQGGIYALGNVVVKASGLLLAPIYLNSRLLPLSDYGYLSILLITAQILIFLIGLGLGIGMLKFGTDPAFDDDKEALPFTVLLTTVVLTSIAVWLLWQWGTAIAVLLLDDPDRLPVIRWLLLYVAFEVVSAIPMMMLRMQERAGYYAIMLGIKMVSLVVGVYWFVSAQEMGLEGVLCAYAAASLLTMLFLVAVTLTRVSWKYQPALVSRLVRYSAPLIFMSLASLILNAGDRYVLKALASTEVVGLYEWGVRISGILNLLVVQSFQLAFTVIGLKELGAGNKGLHQAVFKHFCIWVGWAVLGLSLFGYDLTLILVWFGADPTYLEASPLIFPLSMGFMIYGIYIVVVNVLYAEWKTRTISIIVIGAATLNILINFALIPLFGAMGAALATVLSYSALAGVAAWRAESQMKMSYPWKTPLQVLLIISLLYAVAWIMGPASAGYRFFIHITLFLVYPALVLGLKLYSLREAADFWNRFMSR